MSGPTSVPAAGGALDRLRTARRRFHAYRLEADPATQAGLAIGFAGLTGVAAQLRVPLPFTPVPITLQTFAVLLAGVVLGARAGGASQALYVGLGLAGVPWFQGAGAGLGHLLGPTGGYLVGFVVAALFVGVVVDRVPRARRLPALVGVLLVANALIYVTGLPWLFGWLALVQGSAPTAIELLGMGLLPFVPGDVVKLLAAAAVARAVVPRVGSTGAQPDAEPDR